MFSGKSNSQSAEPSHGSYAAQPAFTGQQLSRLEWWLWFSALAVTTLSSVAFGLSWVRSFFRDFNHFYEIRPEQARWATLALLLLFNSWMLFRQWTFRRLRKQSWAEAVDPQGAPQTIFNTSQLDPVTGLLTRPALEQSIGKEVARARRQNTALSLATVHVDDLKELSARYGKPAVDAALKELAHLLKKASRGSDFAARISEDDFILLLPECGVNEVRQVLNRLGAVEISSSGSRVPLTYTTGWVDYQPGDLPADLLKRAANLLHLYDIATQSNTTQAYGPHQLLVPSYCQGEERRFLRSDLARGPVHGLVPLPGSANRDKEEQSDREIGRASHEDGPEWGRGVVGERSCFVAPRDSRQHKCSVGFLRRQSKISPPNPRERAAWTFRRRSAIPDRHL